MNHFIVSFFLCVFVLLGCCGNAFAIATANWTVSESAPASYGYFIDIGHVYNYKGSSAVAVGRYWLLTAAHVADDGGSGDVWVGGVENQQQEIVFHDIADLALVRYADPFPGFYQLNDSVSVGDEVVIAGYGYPGNAFIGWNSAFFDEETTRRGVLRWGTNRINADLSVNGGYFSHGFRCMLSTIQSGDATLYEAGANTYDSGGGMFSFVDGQWKLTGILANRLGLSNQYSGFNGPAVAYYRDWVSDVLYQSSVSDAIDSDGDGFTDAEEWVGKSNPVDPESYFKIQKTLPPNELVFTSSTDREYFVEYTYDLLGESILWRREQSWFTGSESQTVVQVSAITAPRYFRVHVRIP